MRKIFSTTSLALAIAFTGIPLGVASAQDLQLNLGRDGPRLQLDRDNRDRRGDRRFDRRECTPDRALDKAERMGLRRARISDVGRRTIDVRGFSRRGDRVVISFARSDGRCPVLS